MITMRELYRAEDASIIDETIRAHLTLLHYHLNFIRRLFGEPIIINRGYSTPEEQLKIYAVQGKIAPMGSQHLIGAAADIADPNQKLQRWCLDHLEFLESRGLFLEAFHATPSWVHVQLYPYASWIPGKSIFFEP